MPKLVTSVWTVPLGRNMSKFFLQEHYDGHHRHPNDTCDSFAPEEMLPHPYRLFFTISIAATALISFLLNLFIILTVILSNDNTDNTAHVKEKNKGRVQFRKKYSNTHLSFISLSVSVIIYSSICVPGMYLQTIDDHNKHNFIIRALIFGFYVAPIASSFMHLLMAFDRYLAIKSCFNFRRYWYQRHYLICILLLWVLSILIIVPFFWYKKFSNDVQFTITLIRLLFTFSIPCLLTLALYISLAFELAKINKRDVLELQMSLMKNRQTIVKHRKIIAKIIILALIHFFSWLPYSIVESLNDLFPDLFHRCSSDIHMEIYYRSLAILILITSLTGIAYPVLYCFVSHEFMKLFKRSLLALCLPTSKLRHHKTAKNSINDDCASQSTQKTELSSLMKHTFNHRKFESQV